MTTGVFRVVNRPDGSPTIIERGLAGSRGFTEATSKLRGAA
jgi:hypothetical protein